MIVALLPRPIPFVGVGDPSLLRRAEAFVERTGYPGVWICETKDGRVVGEACAGYADPEDERRARLDDVLRIGSVSKPIFAAVVAEAVREGRIAYGDRAYDVLPELRAEGRREYADVTLEMLLAHTAGIGRDPSPTPFDVPPRPARYSELCREDALRAVEARPAAKPGTRYLYSNAGIEIAAAMLERRTHRSYASWFDEVVRGRLHLASAGLGEVEARGTAPHLLVNGKVVPSPPGTDAFYGYAPSGNAHATIADVARFGLVYCDAPFGSRLFDEAFLERLRAPAPASLATLASLRRRKGKHGEITLLHGGTLVNQRGDATEIAIDPARGIVVVAYTNVAQVPTKGRKSPNETLVKELIEPILDALRASAVADALSRDRL